MLGDVSIGRHVPGRSAIHLIDARTKLLGFVALSIGVLQGDRIALTAIHCGLTICVLAAARLPWRFIGRSVRPFLWLSGIVLGSHLLVGGWGAITTGVSLAGRLLVMIVLASLLTWTTRPLDLIAAVRSIGSPLGRLGLPVDTGATAVGLALRFAPIALSEATTIIRAQRARGADFGGIGRMLSLAVPLLGALFERAFGRADALAEAMESRGYLPGAPRTYFRTLKWHRRDIVAACVIASWVVGAMAL
jgi:energy-coupling factor transport system permease protein